MTGRALPEPGPPSPRASNTISGGAFATAVQAGHITSVTITQPTPQPGPVPRQLPRRTRPFLGREADLALLAEAFADERAIVLHGVPGSGLTRLAAEALVPHDGPVLYADLRRIGAGADPVLLVLAAWARALGHEEPMSRWEAEAWWWTASGSTACAVLVDNATALPGGALAALLPVAGPAVVTSPIPVAELASGGAVHHRLGGLEPEAALRLLAHRADPRLLERLDAERLVDAVGRLPAPLSVLGAHLSLNPHRPVADLLHSLAASGRRPTPETALSDTLHTASQDLSLPLADTLLLLQVLPVPEAEPGMVAAGLGITPVAAEERLRQLEGRFFVVRSPSGRYLLPGAPSTRLPAAGTGTDGLLARVHRAMVWWLAGLTAAERLLTPTHRELERESADGDGKLPIHPPVFHSPEDAWRWLAEQHRLLPEALAACAGRWPALTWQIFHAAWPLWQRVGDTQLRLRALDLALPAVLETGSPLAVQEIYGAAVGVLRDAGRHREALAAARTALTRAREREDLRGEGQYLHAIGATLHAAGHPQLALPCLRKALDLRERDNYPRGIALTLLMIGACRSDLRRIEEAGLDLTAARRMLKAASDRLNVARARAWEGRNLQRQGNCAAAHDRLQLAVGSFADLGARVWEARATFWSAEALDGLGRTAEATDALHRAAELFGATHPDETAQVEAALAGRAERP
ncbi:tetratricopeptide repeat protein [Kitasatospora sp. NPDC001664]